MHNLSSFVDHLHLFFGVEIVKENINLRNQVKRNRIMLRQTCGRKNVCLHLTALAVSLGLLGELVNALLAGAGNSLIGRNDDTFNACQVIQRFQCHNHNNCRAVRVGNNALVLQDVLGVNLRHNQRHFGVHTEGAGVINNNGTSLYSVGSKLLGNAATCEQSNINALERVLGSLLHSIYFAHKFNLLACAALGSQQMQFCKWEVSFFNQLQKFSTNSTGSAQNSNVILFHKILPLTI